MKPTIDEINRDINSPWYEVCHTATGRGCISKCEIPKDTVIHISKALSSAISRPFKKEVCSSCFKFSGGKTIKFRLGGQHPLYFCSEQCLSAFTADDIDQIYLNSLLNVESFYNNGLRKPDELELTINEDKFEEQIIEEWKKISEWEEKIDKMKPSKRLNNIPKIGESEYIEAKYIVGILFQMYKGKHHELKFFESLQSNELDKLKRYPQLLQSYTNIYKFVRLTVHTELQPLVTSELIRTILGTNLTNAFGIWSQPVDDAEEKDYFGFAIFPSASFFNHSCYPNLIKTREGDTLYFRTLRDVDPNTELFISYGNYSNENVQIRQEQLREWFFDCSCTKCISELGMDIKCK
ncbi:uncharacterized protein AC631_00624 [Debaryomyces fabryi]|uniref:SET domain-containing protein n=1 Tax=Debaryomyces fabryi TaxID=58627 RepID=A0A0V1Q561_9ASCO|nr:uncharacterized protein AC631_00624 [Debaryomyces fabryi]KSA03649.1 hypothetical protein AC631_00624 [Debaryomyces fabryi]CUM52636.1 unnamed protein product [Debaryomyces fabryi]